MRDLVESVIGQVMRQDRYNAPRLPKSVPHSSPQARPVVQHLQSAAAADGRTPPPNDKLWKACKAFESLFVQQMLSEMHKTVPSSGLLGKGFAEGVQTSMMDQAIADAVGKQGRLGIASSMYRQLSNHYATQENARNGDKQPSPSGPAPAGGKQGG